MHNHMNWLIDNTQGALSWQWTLRESAPPAHKKRCKRKINKSPGFDFFAVAISLEQAISSTLKFLLLRGEN